MQKMRLAPQVAVGVVTERSSMLRAGSLSALLAVEPKRLTAVFAVGETIHPVADWVALLASALAGGRAAGSAVMRRGRGMRDG
jgi:hypothetical protein